MHAQGIPKAISKEELAEDLTELVNQHEALVSNGRNYSIPDDYKLKLIKHITGFRMEITRIEGKFKLGQNRSIEDQQGMLEGLRRQSDLESIALADFIEANIIK